MVVFAFFVFFFFKQKTAYEMSVSDWSSDVCSSDLLEALPVGEVVVGIALVEEDDTREPDAFGKLSDLGLARPLDRARVGELAVTSGREGKDASDTRIDER